MWRKFKQQNSWQQLVTQCFPLLLVLTASCAVIRCHPQTNFNIVDLSWVMAIDYAVAAAMKFGSTIIWQVGPYAALYTDNYHPATASLMFWSQVYLALGLVVVTYLLFNKASITTKILVLLALISTIYSYDALLLYYPLLISTYLLKTQALRCIEATKQANIGQYGILILLLGVLGLLPLIKGHLLVIGTILLVIASLAMIGRSNWLGLVIINFIPLAAMMGFWLLVGQSLADLPLYMLTILQIASGYASAMVTPLTVWQFNYYLIVAIAMLYILWRYNNDGWWEKLLLWLSIALSLFIAGKESFTTCNTSHIFVGSTSIFLLTPLLLILTAPNRWHCLLRANFVFWWFIFDPHMFSGAMLWQGLALWEISYYLLVGIMLLFIICYQQEISCYYPKALQYLSIFLTVSASCLLLIKVTSVPHYLVMTNTIILLAVTCLLGYYCSRRYFGWFAISLTALLLSSLHINCTAKIIINKSSAIYRRAWSGLALLQQQPLMQQWQARLIKLNQEVTLPKLAGSSDIYSYGQSYLLAAGNQWNPRPVIQSYQADTPELIKRNCQHLLGSTKPDNLFFKVETIDDRLPALDDGASWPIILANYQPVKMVAHDYLLLKQHPSKLSMHSFGVRHYNLGDLVKIPAVSANTIIFAKITIRRSLLGMLSECLFRSTLLNITIHLPQQQSRMYRLIAAMAEAGFIITPLIDNSQEFAALYSNTAVLTRKRCSSFVISVVGWPGFWRPSYTVEFFGLSRPALLH
jgi:hypothetical protein